jgi:hypothetical protein
MDPLSPEEEILLARLEEEEAERQRRLRGQRAADAVTTSRTLVTEPTRPFSIYRSTVGALRDAAQGMIDTYAYTFPSVRLRLGPVEVGSSGVIPLFVRPTDHANATLPEPEGSENAGTPERIVRSIGAFMVPYSVAGKAIGGLRGASWLGTVGRGALASLAPDFTQVDPVSGNVANVLRDGFGLDHPMIEALASDPDDATLLIRFKAAAANAPIGIAADGLIQGGARLLQAYRAWRGTAEEAAEIVAAARESGIAEPSARNLDPPEHPVGAADAEAGVAERATRVEPDAAAPSSPTTYDRFQDAVRAAPPRDFDDVLTHLREATDGISDETDLAAAKSLVDALLHNPENALGRLGIDPVKLDYSKFDDPELLGHLLNGLEAVQTNVARALGRTGLRVTEGATIRAARDLATTADALKEVYGRTENLAERLKAAQMFVGAHTHRLIAAADVAMEEITSRGAGEAWTQFLADFHRHAYYVGAVRGAGSEVARALRSLQTVTSVGKRAAAEAVRKADEAAEATRTAGPDIPAGVSDFVDGLTTDAARLAALQLIKARGGDIGELARLARRKNMSRLRRAFTRVDDALKETRGNFWSGDTLALNLGSGGVMLGINTLSRLLASVGRMAVSPLGGRHAMAARIATMDAWAYADGILGGFREATHGVLKVLEKEGMAEVALNLDALGFANLAKNAAARSARAADAIGGSNFERVETSSTRALAITEPEMHQLRAIIDGEDGPTSFSRALGGLTKVLAAPVNAAGSLTRLGTTLFINMPDQFIGVLSARAGARSQAVRLAASEAAELGLEGADLSRFLKARVVQLAQTDGGWHPEGFRAGVDEASAAHGDAALRQSVMEAGHREALANTFQDDLEFGLNRGFVRYVGQVPLAHMLLPIVKTPLRILERTAIDFTPLGLLKDRMRRAIIAGGPEGDEARARMALGVLLMGTAFQLADDRTVIGTDGSFRSSSRIAGRPMVSLRVGDDLVELQRVDPLGTLLGFAADMRTYMDAAEDDPEADTGLMLMAEAMLWALGANILNKTWLTTIRNVVELADAAGRDEATFSQRANSIVGAFAIRTVPASGIQRQLTRAGDGFLREADGFIDNWIKNSLGSSTLPIRRDVLLGRPMQSAPITRLIQVDRNDDDPLMAELDQLSFDVPMPRRSIEGVRMTPAEFSRYLELRGQIVEGAVSNMTLESTLRGLIATPEYQALNRTGRVAAIRDNIEAGEYHRLAVERLLQEDRSLAFRVLRREVWSTLELQGASQRQKVDETRRAAIALGIPIEE